MFVLKCTKKIKLKKFSMSFIVICTWILIFCYVFRARASESLQVEHYSKDSDEKFYARDCDHRGGRDAAFHIISLDVTPDPLLLGHYVTIKGDLNLTRDVGENRNRIEADMSVRMRTPDKPIEVCELLGEFKCHFPDLCKEIKCDLEICRCPFKKGHYFLPRIKHYVDPLPFKLRGSFDITINMREQGVNVGCIDLHFCVGNCKPWEVSP